jgi:endoglucanase
VQACGTTPIKKRLTGTRPFQEKPGLGQGTAIKWMDSSVLCDQRRIRFLKSCAVAKGIPWQPELLPAGGTDTSVVQQAAGGCIAGAISIPTRHIHQVIEMVNRNDVRHTIDLCLEAMIKIDSYDFSF